MKNNNLLVKFIVKIINIYQKYLSPDHSSFGKKKYPFGYCKYHPTCSEYSKLSFKKYWVIKWFFKSTYRIFRCNPCSKWWIDNP